MSGFLETFVRYVDQIGGDPSKAAAARVRGDESRPAGDRKALADDMERIGSILGLGGDR